MLRRGARLVRIHRYFPLLVAVALVVLGGLLAWSIERAGEGSRRQQLERAAHLVSMRIEEQIGVLEGVRGLFRARPDVSREDVQRYLAAVRPERRAPGMLGVGFAMALDSVDLSAASRALRVNYDIRREAWPRTREPVAFPIVLLEPQVAGNRRALGYDMYSEAVRRSAMNIAWETGEATATRMVQLVQDGDRPTPGFLVYLPLYSPQGRSGVTADGRPPITGFIYAPYRIKELMGAVEVLQDYSYRVAVPVEAGGPPLVVAEEGEMGADAISTEVVIAGQGWIVTLEDNRQNPLLRASIVTFIGSLLLAAMLAGLLWSQARRLDAIANLAEERAARTRDKDLMLREMSHRMKNVLARVQAIARSSARSAGSLEGFVEDFGGRLQAMGNALRLLSAADGGQVLLSELVDAEFAVIGDDVADRVKLDGPALLLDEQQSQSLGLAIHELATNSIKYGALGSEGRLTICWRLEAERAVVDWSENDLPCAPSIGSEGFGSRFLRALIVQQLRGGVEREAGEDDYRVTIWFPLAAARPAAAPR